MPLKTEFFSLEEKEKALLTFIATMEGIAKNDLLKLIIIDFGVRLYPKETEKVFGSNMVKWAAKWLERVLPHAPR